MENINLLEINNDLNSKMIVNVASLYAEQYTGYVLSTYFINNNLFIIVIYN